MAESKVLRIERIRFDYLRARVEGFAVMRDPTGKVVRRPVSTPADVDWSHDMATTMLRRTADDTLHPGP